MWIHIILFTGVLGAAAALRFHLLPGLGRLSDVRPALLVVFLGNLLGAAVTWQAMNKAALPAEAAFPKKEVPYEETLLVQRGSEEMTLSVRIPEREREEEPAEDLQKERTGTPSRRLQEEIFRYNQDKQDPDYFYLPDSWEGDALIWRKPKDNSGLLLAALALLGGTFLPLLKEREKEKQKERRREQMLQDYPGILLKFTLLIQAGMPARSAFRKIAGDYEKGQPGRKREAYEEIRRTCREMDTGVSEAEAYRHFGERCLQVRYRTFSILLVQNLQKGSRQMAALLERESTEAWEERKRNARVMGEMAVTKLLVPMMLMLVVVMAVVMIPALLSFYGSM